MLRRNLLLCTALVPVAACATLDTTLATVAADTNTIALGLKGVLAQLGTLNIPGLTTSVMATVGTAISSLQSVAAAIAGTTTTAAAQPLVQKIESYVNTVVGALALLPLPPPISTALEAAAILLPLIETAVGLATNSVMRPRGVMPGMTPDQARLILAGIAQSAK